MLKPLRAALAGSLVLAAAGMTASPAAAAYVSSVVASGLNNPRGLAFGPDGALYIAESGVVSTEGPSTIIRGTPSYYGTTGSITRVAGGVQQRVVTGLPALASPARTETIGAQDIVFDAAGTGYVVVGLAADPAVRTSDLAPGGAGLGRIYTFNADATSSFADLAAFEAARNPDGGALDSNPFHAAALPGGGLLVSDAGGNSLVEVAGDGTVSLVATIPSRFIGAPVPLSDAVPTGVAVGPDGNYYVGQLTGFPFTAGAAQIYRVTPAGEVTVSFTGFTAITDLAFGADGSLYVLEFDNNGLLTPGGTGALSRIAADGTRTTLFTAGLVAPTGLEIGPDGAFYVTNFSAAEGLGEVLRIAQVPEPATLVVLGLGALAVASRRRRAVSPAHAR